MELGTPAAYPIAVITGNHLNAYAMYDALRACGWPHAIAFLKDASEKPAYENFISDVVTWHMALKEPCDLLNVLDECCAQCTHVFLFLTDERFHEMLSIHRAAPALNNVVCYLGSERYMDTTIDRSALYRFLEERRLARSPKTIEGHEDPWSVFGGPFLFRFKRSWRGLRKLDRVRVVRDKLQLDRILRDCRSEGLSADSWCFQEMLSTDPRDNVSVSGWHSGEVQSYCVSRTVDRHPPVRGSALLCELLEGHEVLKQITRSILTALEYHGPFELEFVRDLRTSEFKVIELNARLWLQHSLVQQATGHELTQQYLGLPGCNAQPADQPETSVKKYWINTTHVLAGVLRGKIGLARHLVSHDTVKMPSVPIALRFMSREIMHRLRKTNLQG